MSAGKIVAIVLGSIFGAVFLMIGCTSLLVVAVETPTTESSKSSKSESGVAIKLGKTTKSYGWTELDVTVTNNKSRTDSFAIDIVAESPDGKEQYGTAFVYVEDLKPGQTVHEEATFTESIPNDAVYSVVE